MISVMCGILKTNEQDRNCFDDGENKLIMPEGRAMRRWAVREGGLRGTHSQLHSK